MSQVPSPAVSTIATAAAAATAVAAGVDKGGGDVVWMVVVVW